MSPIQTTSAFLTELVIAETPDMIKSGQMTYKDNDDIYYPYYSQ